ncbi:MAG: rhomboid family intramembrane serine protease [Chthoniobacteraceae bacterium]
MMFEQHDDYKPVTWMRGHAIYATHLIVCFFSLTMILSAILGANVTETLVGSLGFISDKVHSGQVWRLLTYGLVNPPSIGFVIEMVMLIWFARELERFYGRKLFLTFYGALYLFVPVVLTLLGFWKTMALSGAIGGFGCFIAFATLYPGALLIFNLPAQWLAIILVAIYSLIAIYARDVVGLINLWATVGFAYSFVRYQQGRIQLPGFRWPWSKPKFRVVQRTRDTISSSSHEEDDDDELESELDILLDKIARNGLASLSSNERARLELAREALLKKERK